jgi:membrane protein implicated in regulation of membrane protease activity
VAAVFLWLAGLRPWAVVLGVFAVVAVVDLVVVQIRRRRRRRVDPRDHSLFE